MACIRTFWPASGWVKGCVICPATAWQGPSRNKSWVDAVAKLPLPSKRQASCEAAVHVIVSWMCPSSLALREPSGWGVGLWHGGHR